MAASASALRSLRSARARAPALLTHFRGLARHYYRPHFKYLSAWFCPYAHRATLALEHHAEHIDYEWEEALGWEQRPSTVGEQGDGRAQEHFYHWKSPTLLKHSPGGLVPTLVDADGRSVYESLVCVQFVDEVAVAAGANAPLLPADPMERARTRIWADLVNKHCCSPYYGVLVKTDEAGRRESFEQLLGGLRRFTAELRGEFFCGDAISLVDVALLPWAWRYYVLPHYKGEQYAIPKDDPELAKFHRWLEAMEALPQVARTLPDKERYLEHIAKYASDSARSKVAEAVRAGGVAHDIE